MGRPRAIVLADGDVPSRTELDAAWPGWADGNPTVLAADGGARLAAPLGLRIDRWVGDGDSTPPELLAALERDGAAVRRVPSDKDETDTELAVLEAVDGGVKDITILGALGGRRPDHALANVALLAHPALRGLDVRILDGRSRTHLLEGPGSRSLTGPAGGLLSLLPLDDGVEGVTTHDLRFALADEPLPLGPPRGLSNVRSGPAASVTIRSGRLLVIEFAGTFRP
jgi:thiamine pyrophosphokinase